MALCMHPRNISTMKNSVCPRCHMLDHHSQLLRVHGAQAWQSQDISRQVLRLLPSLGPQLSVLSSSMKSTVRKLTSFSSFLYSIILCVHKIKLTVGQELLMHYGQKSHPTAARQETWLMSSNACAHILCPVWLLPSWLNRLIP